MKIVGQYFEYFAGRYIFTGPGSGKWLKKLSLSPDKRIYELIHMLTTIACFTWHHIQRMSYVAETVNNPIGG